MPKGRVGGMRVEVSKTEAEILVLALGTVGWSVMVGHEDIKPDDVEEIKQKLEEILVQERE